MKPTLETGLPARIGSLLFYLGYISLIGPPRATFFATFLGFILLGVQEALYRKTIAIGLGQIQRDKS